MWQLGLLRIVLGGLVTRQRREKHNLGLVVMFILLLLFGVSIVWGRECYELSTTLQSNDSVSQEVYWANHSYQGSCEVVPKCEYLCLELRAVNKRYNECRGHRTRRACSDLVVERMKTYYSFIGCSMYHYPQFRLH
jgi:hypothetical protein